MRKAPVVMLVAMLIGGSLAVGAPAAFATPEVEGLGSNAPGAPQYRPAGPIAKFAAPAATNGLPMESKAGALGEGHAELK